MEYCSSAGDFTSCDSDASCSSECQQRGLFPKKMDQGNGEFHQEYSHHACHGYGREFPESYAEELENRDPNSHKGMHNYAMHHENECERDLHRCRHHHHRGHRDRGYGHHMDNEIGHNYSTEHGKRHNYSAHHERGYGRYIPYERRSGCHMSYERRRNHHLHHEHDHHLHHERGHDHHLQHKREYGHHLHHERDHSRRLLHERGHDHHSLNENSKREHGHHLHNERGHHHQMSHEREHDYFRHLERDHDNSADQQILGTFLHHSLGDNYMQHERRFLRPLRHKRRYDHRMRYKMANRRHRFSSFLNREVRNERNVNCEDSTKVYEPKSKVKITNGNPKYQICLDISHYQPEEVKMKIVNGKIEICAMHESVGDDVYEYHEMHRSFTLPAGIDSKNVSSRLDAEGNFIIEASTDSDNEIEAENYVPVVESNDQ